VSGTQAVSIMGAIIASMRQRAPIFEGRVAGAAEFYKGLRDYTTSMPLPAAYILPLGQDATPNNTYGGLQQIMHKGIGVAVELDAQRDRRGQDPTMQFETIEAQILSSVLNLYIGDCRMTQGAYFTGARYLDLDRARLWYQWEFGLDWQITDLDGVQPDAGIDLAGIEVDFFQSPGALAVPGKMPAVVVSIPTDGTIFPPTNGPWPPISNGGTS